MQARYYDPVIGRFYSNDPVDSASFLNKGNLHGFNRYAYANNNPYKYTDPDGYEPVGLNFGVSWNVFGYRGSLDAAFVVDTETLELGAVFSDAHGIGVTVGGPAAGDIFVNALWTSDGVTIDDLGGNATQLSRSINVGAKGAGGSMSIPTTLNFDENNRATIPGDLSFDGAVYEVGLSFGNPGADAGVTVSDATVYKTGVIGDAVKAIDDFFND